MKIGDQKVQRTLKKQMVRGLLLDKKVPGTRAGNKTTAAPGPHPLGLLPATGLLGESRVKGSLPCQTRLEQHPERPGCLKSQGGEQGRSSKPTEIVGASWGELRAGLCGALAQTVPALAGEVGCVRGQALPCTERQV